MVVDLLRSHQATVVILYLVPLHLPAVALVVRQIQAQELRGGTVVRAAVLIMTNLRRSALGLLGKALTAVTLEMATPTTRAAAVVGQVVKAAVVVETQPQVMAAMALHPPSLVRL